MNQRVIKFRVWDNVDYMSKPFTLYDLMGSQAKIQFTHDCIVMQYTGLNDKEGREIYEGDVVLLPGNPDPAAGDPTAMCVVEYSGPHLVYRDVDRMDRKEMIHGILGWDVNEDEDAEVIGNIYQNPELLQQ